MRRRTGYILGNLYDSERGGYFDDASEPLLALQAKGETATIHYLQCSDSFESEIPPTLEQIATTQQFLTSR